jgi:hypothetical protein
LEKEFVGKVKEEVPYMELLSSSDEVIFIDIGRSLDTVKYNYFTEEKISNAENRVAQSV